MKLSIAVALFASTLALAGCLETAPTETVAVTGGDLTGTTATNCRAAIAQQTNLTTRDVAIFDVVESEAGNVARATVAGADTPWVCRTDRNGIVGQVMFEGQG